MKNSRIRALSIITLIITDSLMITFAFLTAYGIRWESAQLDPNIKLAPFGEYLGLLIVQIVAIGVVMFWARLYHQARAVSRVDEFYGVFGAVSIGMMLSVAISTLLFKNLEFDFPRTLIIYSWLLTIVLVMIGAWVSPRCGAAGAGHGRDKVSSSTGDTANGAGKVRLAALG
jgi:FlaA1/EpsC-like NDP-sugar epimerase